MPDRGSNPGAVVEDGAEKLVEAPGRESRPGSDDRQRIGTPEQRRRRTSERLHLKEEPPALVRLRDRPPQVGHGDLVSGAMLECGEQSRIRCRL